MNNVRGILAFLAIVLCAAGSTWAGLLLHDGLEMLARPGEIGDLLSLPIIALGVVVELASVAVMVGLLAVAWVLPKA